MPTFRKSILAALVIVGSGSATVSAATGKFGVDDYRRALWMTTRYYGGQRSGTGPNWLLIDHTYKTSFVKDADGSVDLEGGWFDCGDHVLFGQTFFYSSYMLAKAYDIFPRGFEDNYHGTDYSDYEASRNWDMDGGTPDGIPDVLQELKYATDWIIKATPNGSTFYSQKGNGDLDHKLWMTAGKMATQTVTNGGESDGIRPITKNPADGSMPGMAAATLAVMSRIYRKYSPAYADSCLIHAKYAYAYAAANKGAGVGSGSYYPANANPYVGYVVAASELYAATKTSSYQSDATGAAGNLKNHYYTLCYANQDDLGYYALGTEAGTGDLAKMKSYFINSYTSKGTGENSLSTVGSAWGFLRYPANQAFSVALYGNAAKDESNDQFIYNQVDYILGANNAKESFVVGFCSGCSLNAEHPHNRNVYLNDSNPSDAVKANMPIPQKNKQFGSLVGGAASSTSYAAQDNTTNYQYTEGGIDYNAGLVGALAYIVSKLAPVDTSKLGVTSVLPRTGTAFSLSAHTAGRTIVLSSSAPFQEILVTDLQGRVLVQSAPGTSDFRWTAPSPGLYLTRVRTASGWASSKVMVQE